MSPADSPSPVPPSDEDAATAHRAPPGSSPPSSSERKGAPPGVRFWGGVRWVLVALSMALTASSYWLTHRSVDATSSSRGIYQCPMHPQVVSEEPGECPICHMALVPVSGQAAEGGLPSFPTSPPPSPNATGTAEKDRPAPKPSPVYVCPMHPQVVAHEPGVCPLCHMDLVLREPTDSGAGTETDAAAPPDVVPLELSLDRIQSIGVRTHVVRSSTSPPTFRVNATVASPEQGIAEVHVRTPGFIERIAVRESGVRVSAGQELFSFYSPEVYQAESELLAARRFGPDAVTALQASRQKLELLGVSAKDVDTILTTGVPQKALPIVAPTSGYVTKKNVVLGSYVTPEMTLYEIVDLSVVFVIAEVFPQDIASLSKGAVGKFTVPDQGGPSHDARVDLIYPELSTDSRTTRVRMQIRNEGLRLKPGQYGYVEFARPTQKVLLVPKDAVIDTGKSTYVFVVEGEGHFRPQSVHIERDDGETLALRGGLKEGDRIVSGATFLIDSESRLRGALKAQPLAPPSSPTQHP